MREAAAEPAEGERGRLEALVRVGVGDDEQQRVARAGQLEGAARDRLAGDVLREERIGRLGDGDDALGRRARDEGEDLGARELRDGDRPRASAHGGGNEQAHRREREGREVLREAPVLHVVDGRDLRTGGAERSGVSGVPEHVRAGGGEGAREREVLEEDAPDARSGAHAGRDDLRARRAAQVGGEGLRVLGVGEDEQFLAGGEQGGRLGEEAAQVGLRPADLAGDEEQRVDGDPHGAALPSPAGLGAMRR